VFFKVGYCANGFPKGHTRFNHRVLEEYYLSPQCSNAYEVEQMAHRVLAPWKKEIQGGKEWFVVKSEDELGRVLGMAVALIRELCDVQKHYRRISGQDGFTSAVLSGGSGVDNERDTPTQAGEDDEYDYFE
jgi:hypothetical protein